jgi:hypothetical protein
MLVLMMGGFMNYAVELGLGVLIYIHNKFHKYPFCHSKVNRVDTHRQQSYLISLFLFFKTRNVN